MANNPNAPYEAQNDPSIHPDSEQEPAPVGVPSNNARLPELPTMVITEALATGEHPTVRATGTDDASIHPITDGVEQITQHMSAHEPEDERPDQLDRNK